MCVDWYRISSREGGSGYFIIALSVELTGGLIIGVVIGKTPPELIDPLGEAGKQTLVLIGAAREAGTLDDPDREAEAPVSEFFFRARVKGRPENAILGMGCQDAYILRAFLPLFKWRYRVESPPV